jgi:hypothetical protein
VRRSPFEAMRAQKPNRYFDRSETDLISAAAVWVWATA